MNKVVTLPLLFLLETLRAIGAAPSTPQFSFGVQPDAEVYVVEFGTQRERVPMDDLHDHLVKLGHLPRDTDPGKILVVTVLPRSWEFVVVLRE